MKKRLMMFAGIFFCPLLARSQTVYDGYEEYYQAQGNLFTNVMPLQFSGSRNTVVSWQGKRIELALAKAFSGEFTVNDDLGSNARAYEHFPFACIEGQSSSASGTAVRHTSVYLLEMRPNQKVVSYKLPSLFASCLGIRLDSSNRPLFNNADYIYKPGADLPIGVQLEEYLIDEDKFVPTGHSVALEFVEVENVWKFRVHSVK